MVLHDRSEHAVGELRRCHPAVLSAALTATSLAVATVALAAVAPTITIQLVRQLH